MIGESGDDAARIYGHIYSKSKVDFVTALSKRLRNCDIDIGTRFGLRVFNILAE